MRVVKTKLRVVKEFAGGEVKSRVVVEFKDGEGI